ncbi:MAG: hypothetical protein COA60_008535 [Robiginitomaculum sp.]|nr:hypothetical protein [Robiginitomaculum sp.]
MKTLRQILAIASIWLAAGTLALANEPEPVKDVLPATSAELPWYRSFTLRSSEVEDGAFMRLKKPDLEFRAGNQWGLSVGMNEQDPLLESKDRMSAGAFYEFSPRFRLGGELSFVAPGELRISTPQDSILPVSPIDEQPRVRIESSIKF